MLDRELEALARAGADARAAVRQLTGALADVATGRPGEGIESLDRVGPVLASSSKVLDDAAGGATGA